MARISNQSTIPNAGKTLENGTKGHPCKLVGSPIESDRSPCARSGWARQTWPCDSFAAPVFHGFQLTPAEPCGGGPSRPLWWCPGLRWKVRGRWWSWNFGILSRTTNKPNPGHIGQVFSNTRCGGEWVGNAQTEKQPRTRWIQNPWSNRTSQTRPIRL